jgi:hypothetical protein
MRRERQGRQRIARLFFRKRWLFRGKRSFGLVICLRSDTIPWNRCRKRRFRLRHGLPLHIGNQKNSNWIKRHEAQWIANWPDLGFTQRAIQYHEVTHDGGDRQ